MRPRPSQSPPWPWPWSRAGRAAHPARPVADPGRLNRMNMPVDSKEHMTHPIDSEDITADTRSRGRRPGKKRRGRGVLIAVAVVVALVAVVAGGYLFNLAHTFDSASSKIDQAFPEESTRPQKTGTAINILVMGSDSRGA